MYTHTHTRTHTYTPPSMYTDHSQHITIHSCVVDMMRSVPIYNLHPRCSRVPINFVKRVHLMYELKRANVVDTCSCIYHVLGRFVW